MDISKALKIIKRNLKKEVVETRHFKEQCKARGLDTSLIHDAIKKNSVLGVLDQGDDSYKVWFSYEKDKDLNMILAISQNHRLKLITVFPCAIERRKR